MKSIKEITNKSKEFFYKKDWKNINDSFTPKLQKEWEDKGFSYKECKRWVDAGLNPPESGYAHWLKNIKKVNSEWVSENEEEFQGLRSNYRSFKNCPGCQKTNVWWDWCQSCNSRHFKRDFAKWTSGSPNIDKLIQKYQLEATSQWNILEWIPYEHFTEIEYLAEGGFGKVYKAKWINGPIKNWNSKDGKWERDWNEKEVVLKSLTNSQNVKEDFLSELVLYKTFTSETSNIIHCYGVSRDEENNYIIVMKFMNEGNLKEYLKKKYQEQESYKRLTFLDKLNQLKQIAQGLKNIHCKGLVHKDFHSGNILRDYYHGGSCRIADLGLCRPANEVDDSKIYGVLPYVAPEVLSGKPYTPASDVYSWGMIAYEILTGLPPYHNLDHDVNLALKICKGLRPQFDIKLPQFLADLVNKCWDENPLNRPAAGELEKKLDHWEGLIRYWGPHSPVPSKSEEEIYQQYEEAEAYNETLPAEISFPNYEKHSEKVWHSKPINTKQITELLSTSLMTTDLDLENLTAHTTELNLEDYETELVAQQETLPK